MLRRPLKPEHIEVVDDAVADILRRKTPAQRLQMVFDANRTMRSMLGASIAHEHPDWDKQRVLREVARRMLGGAS